jgi:signal peptidase I
MRVRVPVYQSYRRRRTTRARSFGRYLARLALWVFCLYGLFTFVGVRTARVDSRSMYPALETGDRLLGSPMVYGARLPWGDKRLPGIRRPERGDIVTVVSPALADRGELQHAVDSVVRFLTLQMLTLWPAQTTVPRLLIKRVVATPGDAVRMQDYVAWILPAGGTDWVPETTLIPGYTVTPGVNAPSVRALGGDTDQIVLGPGEYFLLGDNRADSSDSRIWGPVPLDRIRCAVILRYYPFRRFGSL